MTTKTLAASIHEVLSETITEYPIQAFPVIVANAINKSAFYHQVPHSVAGQTYLAQMAYMAQIYINAPSDKKKEGQPCSLAILTIFPSGEGKDVCKDDAAKIIKEIDDASLESFRQDIDAWKSNTQKNKGNRPHSPQSIFMRATTQGLLKHMSLSPSSSYIWSTGEGGYLFAGYSLQQSDTKGDSLSTLTDLIDRGTVITNLGGEDSSYISNKRFCLDISVQDVVVKKLLNDEMFRNQGFMARFLFASPKPLTYKPRTYEEAKLKPYDDSDLQIYWNLCKDLLDKSSSIKIRSILQKNEEANKLHHEYNEFIKKATDLESEGFYVDIAPFAKRSQQYVLRVAAVLAFFDGKDEVDYLTMKNAILIMKYSLDQWLLYLTQNKKCLDNILFKWLKSKESSGTTEFEVSKILQIGPEEIRFRDKRNSAIKILLEKKLIKYKDNNKKIIVLADASE
ncbi:DUF3987 domain-containing protein [Acinetobacter bohemicus]|uniref:DUF3987 domain-containing protein n=1 Tax=Acinetobacter bohemicus TaxID=1435036 RepID=UPI0040425F9A